MKLKKAFVTILILLCAVTVTAASAEESVMIMGDDALAALAQELYACYPKDISGTIEFYQQKPEVEEWYDEAIRLFMKLYPNIIVEQNVQNNASGYLRTRAVYGAFTDVWLYWPTDAVFASFQKRGLIMDVSDEPFVQYSVADIQDLYAFDGKMYGVPIAMNCAGIVCNLDLYEACGLHLPSTWEELMNACSVFRENGIDPFMITAKDGNDVGIYEIYGQYVTTEQVKAIARHEMKYSDIEGWATAIDRILEIYDYGQDNAAATDYNDGVAQFAMGKEAMFMSGNWVLNAVEAINPDIRLELIPMPAGEGCVTSGIDVGLSIGANTKYPDACKAFVNFLSCPAVASAFVNYDGAIPAIRGVTVNDIRVKTMADAIAAGKTFNWPSHFLPSEGTDSAFGEAAADLYRNRDKKAFMDAIDAIMEHAR